MGIALQLRGDQDGLRAEAERALALCPNLPAAHFARGVALIYSGEPKEGVPSVETAVRLDPRHPGRCLAMLQIAMGLYFAGDYNRAIEAAEDTIRDYPDFPLIYRWLAAALGQSERAKEATEALQKARSFPSFDLYARAHPPWMRPEDHAHMLDGLRKAGWNG